MLADRLRALVDALPAESSVTLPAAVLRDWLADEKPFTAPLALVQAESWRERLWTCPADTRLGVREVAEALDRSADWCYRSTSAKRAREQGRNPLPAQKLDGVLVFTAGAVRQWLQVSERKVNAA